MNRDAKSKPHWSEPSEVLRESERLRTRPMNGSTPSGPPHVSVQPFRDVEAQHSSGVFGGLQGPNAHVGYKPTESGGHRADAQVNLGGARVGHRNANHEYAVGVTAGYGGGVELHGGEMPGVSVSAGPFQGTARSTAFNQPVNPSEARDLHMMMKDSF